MRTRTRAFRRLLFGLALPALAASPAFASGYTMAEVGKLNCRDAVDLLKRGRDEGNAQAIHLTAHFVIRGVCFKRDRQAHARLQRQAAEAGLPDAMSDLGYAVALGEGVEQDYATAGAWLRKSGLDPSSRFDDYTLGYASAASRWVGARITSFFPHRLDRAHEVEVDLIVHPRDQRIDYRLNAVGARPDDQESRELLATLERNLRIAIKDVRSALAAPRPESLSQTPYARRVVLNARSWRDPDAAPSTPVDHLAPR
jgi:hypothetical protein